MDDKVRYGIIGIGRWAREVHIPTLNRIDQAEITALSSRNDENLMAGLKVAKGHPKTFKNYHDLLDCPDVDAVIIATPNHTHGEIALRALKKGKHVFCEKPLAITLEECDEIIETTAKTGKVLQVGLELRYARQLCRSQRNPDLARLQPCTSLYRKKSIRLFRRELRSPLSDVVQHDEKSGEISHNPMTFSPYTLRPTPYALRTTRHAEARKYDRIA